MGFKFKRIFWKFDFIGPTPEIRILNNSRYKSIFSSLLSIIIILFSIIFISYSLEEFVHLDPKVDYYKNNDYSTNRTFAISDSLLMFKYSFECSSNSSSNDTNLYISKEEPNRLLSNNLGTETCELGKNIDLKYKDVIKSFQDNENETIDKYQCINYQNQNFLLSSHPSIPRISEKHLQISLSSQCEDFFLVFALVTENDLLEHTKRDDPVVPYYKKDYFLLTSDREYLTYNYQYIKYETDDGFIFSNTKIIDGIGVSGTNLYEKYDLYEYIFSLDFRLNHDNYDYYKREYDKFQSVLADIMSLINLLITISKVVTEFLLYKKMNKDIMRYIITSNDFGKNKFRKNKDIIILENSVNKKVKDDISKKEIFSKCNKDEITENKMDSKIVFNDMKKNNDYEIENMNNKIIKVMKNLDLKSIIKSFFCKKDKKSKLINLCGDIVSKDISIERILKRIYALESEYDLILEGKDKESSKQINHKDISKTKRIIDNIYNELNKPEKKK